MANRKISDLTALTAPATGDLLPIVDISEAAAADKNKKITYGKLLANAPDGSAAAPSFSFDGDPNSGIYSSGADQISIATDGTERFRVDSAGQLKAVSLGTAAAPTFSFTGDPNTGIYSPSADQVAISTNGTGRLFVDASGNIGVGTGSPFSSNGTNLHVLSTGTARLWLQSTAASTGRQFYLESLSTGGLTFADGTAGQERMRLDSSGRLGLGTSSVSDLLQVGSSTNRGTVSVVGTSASTPYIKLDYTAAASGRTYGLVSGSSANGNFDIYDFTASAYRLSIDSSGRVGIGTTSPGELFHLSTTSVSDATLIRLDGGAGLRQRFFPSSGTGKYNWQIAVQSNVDNGFEITPSTASGGSTFSTPAVVVKNDGKVGIGTASPGAQLMAYGASGTAISLNNASTGTTSASGFQLQTGGGGDAYVWNYSNSFIALGTNNTERMRIDSNGFANHTGAIGRGAPVTKTGAFTLGIAENWVICNGTASITATLPTASAWTGREIMIKTIAAFTVISASSNVVPLAGGAAGTAILAATAGKYATLISDGTNWIIMQAN